MKLQGFETNSQIISELGKRIKERRIALNMTQRDVAKDSGVSIRTISGFENGENISLDNLISILRVLRLLQEFNGLFPKKMIDPFEVLEQKQTQKRVYRKRANDKSWQWEE
ncbi:Transcriptional regulator, XRE family [Paracholeplasma brassicae]|uniref:Transcriptional regulator, XRE family n=1 Tax=Acholeplasma brassicae TaxID=61635 RepID=U4KM41_9MOLU|nr:helix-turn-helix transcriptional regulator [Paracholeplasma brassicae]CCV65147.1 Transcriptional regulator, XRE family [Paracholeplasma brassicae]